MSGKMPPGKKPLENCPSENYPQKNWLQENCSQKPASPGSLPPKKTSSRKIASWKNGPHPHPPQKKRKKKRKKSSSKLFIVTTIIGTGFKPTTTYFINEHSTIQLPTIMFIFWWLSKFSFHHKWNKVWLLVINWYIWVASWVAKWLKTLDLRKLWNIRKTPKLHRIIHMLSLPPNWKFCHY